MPSSITVEHPNKKLEMTFTQSDHSYVDSQRKKYMSVTTIIGKAFQQFDMDSVAQATAKRRGVTKQSLILEWSNKGKQAARVGTRMHEHAQAIILQDKSKLSKPENIMQKIRFDGVEKIIQKIKDKYHPEWMQPEKLIFSPEFLLAGSIDLLIKIDDLHYIIVDWKCLNKDLVKQAYGNKCGIILPTLYIQDTNYWHYALQVQIYENILKAEKYVNEKAEFQRFLVAWNGIKFNLEKMPQMNEAWSLMLWRFKLN